jgi:hypothetical protein
MDYQTDHYINKAVSCFGKLELWHRPGQNKERVLVRAIINDIALVPHSLVIRRSSQLPGMGRSWSVPVYILNGRNTIPGLVGNEDDAPPMNASPHPYELPYLSAAQQFDHQQWVQQQVDEAWNQGIPQGQQLQDNGWGLWPVAPPPYRGFSFRTYFQYTGPSLMDGVEQESNISDDPQDEWSVYSDIAEAADNFVRGFVNPELQFVRAGGEERVMVVDQFAVLLEFLGSIYAGIRTPRLTEGNRQDGTQLASMLPFNPLCLFVAVRFAAVYNWDHCINRSPLDTQFAQTFSKGLFIDSDSWSILDSERPEALMTQTPCQSLILETEETHFEQLDMLAHESIGGSAANFTGPDLGDQNMRDLGCENVAPPSNVQNLNDHFGRMILQEPGQVDTSNLRRSTRSTRYDGFRVPQISDTKKVASKVKPRKIPAVNDNMSATAPAGSSGVSVSTSAEIPGPTPISIIQQVGTIKCGIPPEELSVEKLQAALNSEASPP